MKYDAFIGSVARRAGMPQEQAVALTHACLQTLAERITGGEAWDLAAELPKELRERMRTSRGPAESFDLDEFHRRVAERSGMAAAAVQQAAPAVLAALREAVSAGEFQDVVAQLPRDFSRLVEPSAAYRAGTASPGRVSRRR